jgi:hypothetical protein
MLGHENYNTVSYYLDLDLNNNSKNKMKFITSIESTIRRSFEYKNYISYLRNDALLNYCHFFKKIPEEINKKLTIEMHHYPVSLYTIVAAVLERHLVNDLVFTRLSIANEVMDLHYTLQVSIIPLTLTLHQLAHTESLFIDTKDVYGDYKKFITYYEPYISEEAIENVHSLESISYNDLIKNNAKILKLEEL